jgi:hypothetical protein
MKASNACRFQEYLYLVSKKLYFEMASRGQECLRYVFTGRVSPCNDIGGVASSFQ